MSHPAPAGDVYPAPGKLNLFLHVVGRRPDGYHLLQTMFRFIDAADELRIAVRDDGQVRRAAALPGVPEEADLTVRAGRALQAATGCRLGAEIELDKRLPMGGGVGGGSSDAATTLIALNRLWDLGLRRRELMEIGLGLGADVPVFLFGRSAFAEGIGEQLAAVEIAPAWYVLLTPQVHVATAEIFADPALTRDSEAIKIPAFFTGAGRNDLEPVVCRKYPEVAAHLQWLALYGEARMTGSGACVFAAFPEEEQARQVLDQLPRWMNGLVVRGMDEHPLLGLVPD